MYDDSDITSNDNRCFEGEFLEHGMSFTQTEISETYVIVQCLQAIFINENVIHLHL